jgi:hypothetical protein
MLSRANTRLPAGGKPQTLAEAGKRVAAAKSQIYIFKDDNIGRVIRRASTVNAEKPKQLSVYVRSDYSKYPILVIEGPSK